MSEDSERESLLTEKLLDKKDEGIVDDEEIGIIDEFPESVKFIIGNEFCERYEFLKMTLNPFICVGSVFME